MAGTMRKSHFHMSFLWLILYFWARISIRSYCSFILSFSNGADCSSVVCCSGTFGSRANFFSKSMEDSSCDWEALESWSILLFSVSNFFFFKVSIIVYNKANNEIFQTYFAFLELFFF